MITEKQHQEWKKDLEKLHKLKTENKRLREVIDNIHQNPELLEQDNG